MVSAGCVWVVMLCGMSALVPLSGPPVNVTICFLRFFALTIERWIAIRPVRVVTRWLTLRLGVGLVCGVGVIGCSVRVRVPYLRGLARGVGVLL